MFRWDKGAWLLLALGALAWLWNWLADETDQLPGMAQLCPRCTSVVRPVVTRDRNADEDDPDDWLDEEAGVHCPQCQYRFGNLDGGETHGPNHR